MLNDGRGNRITGIHTNYTNAPTGWHQLTSAQIAELKLKPEYAEMGIEGVLKDADLLFDVDLMRGAIENPYTGKMQPLNTYSVFRNDANFKELGSGFSANYVPVAYKDALEAVFGDLRELGATPCRAISLNEGSRCALQFIMPDTFYAADLAHKMFANLFAGHDGKTGIVVNSSDTTIVCLNTYAMAKADKTLRQSAKHTSNVAVAMAEIRHTLKAQTEAEKQFMEFLNTAALANMENKRSAFVGFMLPEPEERVGIRKNSAIANRQAELQLAIDTSVSERNGSFVTAHDLFQGVTRNITYRTQNRTDAEQFEYVIRNAAPQQAKAWIMEEMTR
jgi:hypothetical protein